MRYKNRRNVPHLGQVVLCCICFLTGCNTLVGTLNIDQVNTAHAIPDYTKKYTSVVYPKDFTFADTPSRFFWLDNTLILMSINMSEHYADEHGLLLRKNIVIVWNTITNNVTEYMEGHILCFNPRDKWVQIEKINNQPDTRKFVQGEWGSEMQPYMAVRGEKSHVNEFSCRRNPGLSNRLLPDKHITTPLYEDHGLLDWGQVGTYQRPWMKTSTLTYRITGKKVPVEITYLYNELNSSSVKYYQFADAYLLSGNLGISIANEPRDRRAARLLTPDGKVSKFPVPSEFWEKNYYRGAKVLYSRAGIIWQVPETPGIGSIKLGGAYIQDHDGKIFKVSNQGFSKASVSPDGCRIAYVYGISKPEKSHYRNSVRVTDLCKGVKDKVKLRGQSSEARSSEARVKAVRQGSGLES